MEASTRIDQLWSRFWSGELAARQELILAYLPLVKRIVGRLAINMPGFVERSDLEGAAVLGLMEAIGSYRPEKGVKFETYAVARIRGAALDSMRCLDFVPRSVRQKARLLQSAIERLITRLGRQPDQGEIARELGLSEADLARWGNDLQSTTILSLDTPLDDEQDVRSGLELLPDDAAEDPASRLLSEERITELADAIEGLSLREQQLLSLYYDQGLTLKELGKALRVSESRACQIHTTAIMKLRAKMLRREVGDVGG